MKSLRSSLVDYELALLKAIAHCRGIPLDTPHHAQAVEQLAEALLSPANTAIMLADLSPAETEALQFLAAGHGQADGARFVRRYGAIRPMGPARLERERPWETPANPAEGLWYRGFIFKAFLVKEQGGQEIIYIPDDLLPLIESNISLPPPTPSQFQVEAVSPPPYVPQSFQRARENFFSLLIYLQTHSVKAVPPVNVAERERPALIEQLLPPLRPEFSRVAELEFWLHLGQRADLLLLAHGRLRPNREPVRRWLQAHAAYQTWLLQNSWRADPTWNDLWHVPGLVPQPTGWENSPLRARSKILEFVQQSAAAPDQWLSINSFVAAIKQSDPDFQRPHGDYESWYIQDEVGNSLMGFEHWGEVEGALIRHLLIDILPNLDVLELGAPAADQPPDSFRLTEAGRRLLFDEPPPEEPTEAPAFLLANDKFQIRTPTAASLYDRFQLARFAQLEERNERRALYKITRRSLGRALRNGVTPEQITAFLTRATNNRTPLKVVETLRTWGTHYGAARLEQATILRLSSPQTLTELQQHPLIGPLLGEAIGPAAVLVPASNITQLRKTLTDLGYLE